MLNMSTIVVQENKPRRRTSTSVRTGNGSVDLACDSDSHSLHYDKPLVAKDSAQQQQCSALSTILVLASLFLFALYVTAGRWKGARSNIADFLAGTSHDAQGIPSLGILLHPESHQSRNASIITLHWTITSDFRAPDGVKKMVYLINGNRSISISLPTRRAVLVIFGQKQPISSHLSQDTHNMTCRDNMRLLTYLSHSRERLVIVKRGGPADQL